MAHPVVGPLLDSHPQAQYGVDGPYWFKPFCGGTFLSANMGLVDVAKQV